MMVIWWITYSAYWLQQSDFVLIIIKKIKTVDFIGMFNWALTSKVKSTV